jgi:hypothetical protein
MAERMRETSDMGAGYRSTCGTSRLARLRQRRLAPAKRLAVLLEVRVVGLQELLGYRHGLFEFGQGRRGILVVKTSASGNVGLVSK